MKGHKLKQALMFFLTYASYASVHIGRKAFSTSKIRMEEAWVPALFESTADAEVFLGTLDSLYMFVYGLGLFIVGRLTDVGNPRYALVGGLVTSSLAIALFASAEQMGINSKLFYGFMWALNGLFQCACYPASIAIMGNWFGKDHRGLALAGWASCSGVGNIIGSFLMKAVEDEDWSWSFFLTSFLLLFFAVIDWFLLEPHPLTKDMVCQVTCDSGVSFHTGEDSCVYMNDDETKPLLDKPRTSRHSLKSIWDFVHEIVVHACMPGVLSYSLCYACLKFVNYGLFYWLPFYLTKALDYDPSVANFASTAFDAGGIVGGAVGGFASDRLGRRAPIVSGMLFASVGLLYLYRVAGQTEVANLALMALVGLMISGATNIVCAAVAADLGKSAAEHGHKEAVSTMTGIVDGSGSVGAGIGQYFVPFIQTKTEAARGATAGWDAVFYFLMASAATSGICVTPLAWREAKVLQAERKDSGVVDP
eukprot:Colp12_sorted_trinity150504_noHs@10435